MYRQNWSPSTLHWWIWYVVNWCSFNIYVCVYTCILLLLCWIGIEHKLHFTRCKCEPLAVTITRAQLWPATPTNPSYAFTFSLLDWAEALMLESQVALKDFCNTLKFKCPFHSLKVLFVYIQCLWYDVHIAVQNCYLSIEERFLFITDQLIWRISVNFMIRITCHCKYNMIT